MCVKFHYFLVSAFAFNSEPGENLTILFAGTSTIVPRGVCILLALEIVVLNVPKPTNASISS